MWIYTTPGTEAHEAYCDAWLHAYGLYLMGGCFLYVFVCVTPVQDGPNAGRTLWEAHPLKHKGKA